MAYRGIIATESAQVPQNRIALEDEEVAVSEAQELAAEIPADLADAERSVDVAEGLQSVAEVADNIESPTATDIALIQTAGDLAVAGSDVPAEEVIPVAGEALESAIGRRIATESIRETAVAIYRRLEAFVKRIWEKIEAFWHRHFGTLPRLKRKIEEMKKRVEATSGKKLEGDAKKFEISSGLKALSVDYKAVKSGAELKSALDYLYTVAKEVYVSGAKGAAETGKEIAKLISEIEDSNIGEKAQKVCGVVANGFKQFDLRNVAKKDVSSQYGENYERSAAYKDIKKAREELNQASAKAAGKVGKIKAGQEGGPSNEDVAIFRACLNFNISYTNWTTSVQVGLSSRVATTTSAVLALVAKSMSQYK